MNFLDWMNMNMIVDIAFLVFACAVVWKLRSYSKIIEMHKQAIVEMHGNIKVIDDKSNVNSENIESTKELLKATIKNPLLAKRNLKK